MLSSPTRQWAERLHQHHQRGTGFNHDGALAVLHELGQLGGIACVGSRRLGE